MPPFFFVFDVESVGLHGDGFAAGIHVMDSKGAMVTELVLWTTPTKAMGTKKDLEWVSANVPSHLGPDAYRTLDLVRDKFWEEWMAWKAKGALMFADCQWPVEARFLMQCVADDSQDRNWEGPYPLHDIATVCFMKGIDPLKINERLPNELPFHHPLMDARQSARILREALSL